MDDKYRYATGEVVIYKGDYYIVSKSDSGALVLLPIKGANCQVYLREEPDLEKVKWFAGDVQSFIRTLLYNSIEVLEGKRRWYNDEENEDE